MSDGSVRAGWLLECLRSFLENKDFEFVQVLCAVCGERKSNPNSDSDSAEFLAGLLEALSKDFPLFGDLFATRVSVVGTCRTCESHIANTQVCTVLVVPPQEHDSPLSTEQAFASAVEHAHHNLLSHPCQACGYVCFVFDAFHHRSVNTLASSNRTSLSWSLARPL